MSQTIQAAPVRYDVSLLSENDAYLFNEGSHYRLYEKLGAHLMSPGGDPGTCFGVWAPNARDVSVIGSFNHWQPGTHKLRSRGNSGVWEGFIPGVGQGALYKFHIESHHHGHRVDKADPFGLLHERPPRTASVVWNLDYQWSDGDWMQRRAAQNSLKSPISIYEVHIGSWMRVSEEHNRPMTYRELAPKLADYVHHMGFTHVEFLPVMEHPFYGSWGYQTTGYFAPTSRFGTPQDFMYLVDHLHQRGIGVILDWVPSHFPSDAHGLAYFDGTHLFEHADSRQGFHPDWKTHIFNYGRTEVRSFLMSSAMFWLDKYHADGLRVDAVASMLYLDYSRKEGEWIPNQYGGRENIEAIDFLRRFNEEAYKEHPDIQTIAEESTAWPMVSRPVYVGGLGFGMKWDMGWMHDTLSYFSHEPIHRQYHHNLLTFRMLYGFTENFVLPLSHDEVVHGKGSLLNKMPGDEWQKFANLRLLFAYMYAQPGKKLLFMGDEFGQTSEWNYKSELDWQLLQYDGHKKLKDCVADLNKLLQSEPALHENQFSIDGFEWVDLNHRDETVVSYKRKGKNKKDELLIVLNLTTVVRNNWEVYVYDKQFTREIFNSNDKKYWGSGDVFNPDIRCELVDEEQKLYKLTLNLPPLGGIVLK